MNRPHDWVTIPAGPVTLAAGGYLAAITTFTLPPFALARYPVTNTQFGEFIAAGGYTDNRWWCAHGREALIAGARSLIFCDTPL